MCVGEVKQKHFDEFPVLLIIDVLIEVDLKLLNFLEALGQFEEDKKAQVADSWKVGEDIQEQNQ